MRNNRSHLTLVASNGKRPGGEAPKRAPMSGGPAKKSTKAGKGAMDEWLCSAIADGLARDRELLDQAGRLRHWMGKFARWSDGEDDLEARRYRRVAEELGWAIGKLEEQIEQSESSLA